MIIGNNQIEAFRKESFSRFEEEMIVHIRDFFPNHSYGIGEKNIRCAIKYVQGKAKTYGLVSVRNVCLYLNNALLLGSNFDVDIQYPWAHKILTDTTFMNPNERIDALSDTVVNFISHISGENNIYLYRAISNITENKNQLYKQLITSEKASVLKLLAGLFPQKFEIIGSEALDNMLHYGKRIAAGYGLVSDSCLMVYWLMMYFLGSRFDIDPQFSCAKEILKNSSLNEEEKSKHLFYSIVNQLEAMIIQSKRQNLINV